MGEIAGFQDEMDFREADWSHLAWNMIRSLIMGIP